MRPFLIVITALAGPHLAYAGALQCALPSGPATAAFIPAAQAASVLPAPTASTLPVISPEQIQRIPALRRIASNGAELLDLGTEHGLRGIFARHGERFQVFYLAPDGQALVSGVMWEASGRNVTRQQVTPIDGAIPTVTIGNSAHPAAAQQVAAQAAAVSAVQPAASPLAASESTNAGIVGDPKAPKLWVYIDPLCSYSVRAMEQLRPYIAGGRVQVAVVPVSVLDYEDQGRSTLAAKAMLSLPSEAMVAAWAANKLNGPSDPTADARLATNMLSAESIGLRGTPTFVWRGADGKEGRADGLPDNLEALIASLGK